MLILINYPSNLIHRSQTPMQPEVEEEPDSGAGTQHVPVEPETPLINQDRLPVGLGSLDPGLFDISIL